MKFLIIGSGSIGKRHLGNLQRLGWQDVLAHDTQETVLEDIKKDYGVQTYSSLEIALGEAPDIVILANPTAFHIPYALASAKAGTHLFIEKPISHSMEGIPELLATVQEKNLLAMIAYSLRFFEGIRLMRDLIIKGEVGEPLYVRVEAGQYLPDWRPGSDYRKGYSAQLEQGGGVILDLSHELDYILWLFGPVRNVSSMMAKVGNLEIDVEDTADILMEHQSGVISSVHLDYLQRVTARTCKVVGSEGTLIWDYSTDSVQVYTSRENTWQQYEYQADRNDMYIRELEHFIDCVRHRKKPLISLDDGIKVLQVAMAAKKSAQSGQRQEVEDVI
jgi:predicted dehydrogenase